MINSYVKEMVVAAIVIGVLAAIALMMQGCTHDGCTPEETRCGYDLSLKDYLDINQSYRKSENIPPKKDQKKATKLRT